MFGYVLVMSDSAGAVSIGSFSNGMAWQVRHVSAGCGRTGMQRKCRLG